DFAIATISGVPPAVALSPRNGLFSECLSLDTRVGQYENSPAFLLCTNGVSWYAIPFRIKPAFGQTSEYVSHSPAKDAWWVFHEYKPGAAPRSHCANDPKHVEPESRALARDSDSWPGVARIGAGESSTDEVNRLEFCAAELSDVAIALYMRPV